MPPIDSDDSPPTLGPSVYPYAPSAPRARTTPLSSPTYSSGQNGPTHRTAWSPRTTTQMNGAAQQPNEPHRPSSLTIMKNTEPSSSSSLSSSVSTALSSNDPLPGTPAYKWMVFLSSLSLIIAVASMSAVGPLFLYLEREGLPPILACAWRNQTMCLFLFLPALFEWRSLPKWKRQWEALRVPTTPVDGKTRRSPKVDKREDSEEEHPLTGDREMYSFPRSSSALPSSKPPSREWHVSWYLLGVSLTWAGSLVLWVAALPHTATPRASLFCSTYPLLLVPYMRFVQKVPVSIGESIGVLIAFLGIVVSETDSIIGSSEAVSTDANTVNGNLLYSSSDPFTWSQSSRQLYGDLLCLGSSLLLGINILLAERTRKVLPLFTYTASTAFIVLLMLCFGSLVLEGSTWSRHPMHGLFGWLTPQWFWLMIAFGFVVGMVGVLGFNFAVKYVNPLLFSSTQLLDPGLTGVLSWLAGLEGLPNRATFIGISIVTVGIGFITYYQHRRENPSVPPVRDPAKKLPLTTPKSNGVIALASPSGIFATKPKKAAWNQV